MSTLRVDKLQTTDLTYLVNVADIATSNMLSKSVKNFGAVGDGVTDDTVAVQNAFANSVMDFPEGTYLVTDVSIVLALKNSTGKGIVKYGTKTYSAGDITDTQVILDVPSIWVNIQEALDWLRYKRIKGESSLATVKVADGTYSYNFTINPNVIDYKKLQIIGNQSNRANVVLNFEDKNRDGFLFEKGYGCGLLDGFTINGTYGWISKGVWNSDGMYISAIHAKGPVEVYVGPNMYINKYYYGIKSEYGALVSNTFFNSTVGGGIIINNAGDVGFHAFGNGSIYCNHAEAYNCSDIATDLGYGFLAEAGGMIHCEFSKSGDNRNGAYGAFSNGKMWAHGVDAGNNERHGVFCIGGNIECNSLGPFITNIYGNGTSGITCLNGGVVSASNSIVSGSVNGIVSSQNSTVIADGCSVINSSNTGYLSEYSSFISAINSAANNNSQFGFRAQANSLIRCNGFGGAGNGTFCSPIQTSINDSSGNRGSWMINN